MSTSLASHRVTPRINPPPHFTGHAVAKGNPGEAVSSIRTRSLSSVLLTIALCVTGLGVGIIAAPSAGAALAVKAAAAAPAAKTAAADAATNGPAPVQQPGSTVVTADALPTAQIDSGVVWGQVIVGNVVYAGGSFSNARPAGAAGGTNLSPRGNLLSYTLSTGALSSFAPSLNGAVQTLAKSPDGSRVYAGGSFTTADGATHNRIVAYSTATGQVISSFNASVDNGTVKAIVATNTTVYVSGLFYYAAGLSAGNMAAFSASTGARLNWRPTANLSVDTMVMTPDGSKIVIGGRFDAVNGVAQRGMAALDPSTGALLPWAANQTILNGLTTGNNPGSAGIYNLSADGNAVYGTGWVFSDVTNGNLEGAFSTDPATGDINWIEACHGDTYGAYSDGTTVYTISHAHYCSPVGGYPQTTPVGINMRHALAFTASVQGTEGRDEYAGGIYHDWFGSPAPAMINWFPDFGIGTATGQSQAAWTTTGNGSYVVMGGEFPTVNGTAQYGLARFATRAAGSPHKSAPMLSGAHFDPALSSQAAGSVRVSFQSNWDRDSKTLTYNVVRNGVVVYTTTGDSEFWNRPNLGFVDTGLTPGVQYRYRIQAVDPDGNSVFGDYVNITASSTTLGTYAKQVIADGAAPYWRLDETSGTAAIDWNGFNDGVVSPTVTHGTTGALLNDTDTATTFDGNKAVASTATPIVAPDTFSIEAWIKTTTMSGGKIIGFGDQTSALSSSYDRQMYMDNAGHIYFGVYNNGTQTLNSSTTYNDGQWHHIVATESSTGMALYIDDIVVGTRADNTTGQPFSGYWRVGGDNLNGWPSQPSSNFFAGAIDEVAIYATALSRMQVDKHWVDSGRTSTIQAPPADAYGKLMYNSNGASPQPDEACCGHLTWWGLRSGGDPP